jgi:hypothetical protein
VIDFPSDAEFSKKKTEANAGLVEGAVRALTGSPVRLDCRLNGDPGRPAILSEEELLARLKEEFDAREVGEDSPSTGDSPSTADSATDRD